MCHLKSGKGILLRLKKLTESTPLAHLMQSVPQFLDFNPISQLVDKQVPEEKETDQSKKQKKTYL